MKRKKPHFNVVCGVWYCRMPGMKWTDPSIMGRGPSPQAARFDAMYNWARRYNASA